MLLIIDMLVDFLDRFPATERAALVAAIRALADVFRQAGHPVAWVRQEFAPDLSDAFLEMRRDNMRVTIAGTPGASIIPEPAPRPDDPHFVKKRYSAFFGRLSTRSSAPVASTRWCSPASTHMRACA